MPTGMITLCLMLIGSLMTVQGYERSLKTKQDFKEARAYIEPWSDQDLLAEEDSSVKYKVISNPVRMRTKRNSESWRTPRDYKFVTRTIDRESSLGRNGRLIESTSGGRFYDDRPTYPDYSRNNVQDQFNRRTNFPNKRIIYYATLPEPTRRPDYERFLRPYDYRDREYERQYNYDKYYDRYYNNPSYNSDYDRYNEYYNRYDQNYNRQYEQANYNRPSYPGYPPTRDNEITRVQSSIIDVTSKDEKTERERDDPGLAKYVIIDREPPYLKDVYNFLSGFKPNSDSNKYTEFLAQYNKVEPTQERNTRKPPRKQSSVPIPPVGLTIFKGKPLDVRPLDISVETSSNTSSKDRPTSTHKPTTLNPIQEFERTYKY